MLKALPLQFVVFVAGGVLSALADLSLMRALLHAGVAPLAAASAGFGAGLLVNYAFHAKVTFRRLGGRGAVPRYLAVVALNYSLTLAMVALAQYGLDAPLAGKLASLPVVAVNGYLLSKHWVFK